jgi:hypothetical protein
VFYRCGSNKECVEPDLHVGDGCERDDQCRDADSYCDIETKTCMLPKPDGARCFDPNECESWVCDLYQRACVRCEEP